jgi:hypothetical protein
MNAQTLNRNFKTWTRVEANRAAWRNRRPTDARGRRDGIAGQPKTKVRKGRTK